MLSENNLQNYYSIRDLSKYGVPQKGEIFRERKELLEIKTVRAETEKTIH